MNNEYVLSCCSTADLKKEHFEGRNIKYICFHYFLDGVQHDDDLGQTISFEEFYKAMENGADTRTSQLNADEFEEYFTPFLEDGKDIIHISLSSGLSGACNSAQIAANSLRDKYPDRKIFIVDSLAASSGFGLLVDKLADLRDEGYSIEQLYDWANDNKLNVHHWFFSTDLTFYVKGGRVSKASGFFGTMLHICPLLNVDNNGKLIPRFKIKGKKRVKSEIVKQMEFYALDRYNYSEKCYISHSACLDDACDVAKAVEALFPHIKGNVVINDIGTTIGSHSGPGTVALFFWGDKRIN